jgi:hypothetical protein
MLTGNSATLDSDLSPPPLVFKMLIIDDGLPQPLDMIIVSVCIGEDLEGVPFFGPHWLGQFRRMVGSGVGPKIFSRTGKNKSNHTMTIIPTGRLRSSHPFEQVIQE